MAAKSLAVSAFSLPGAGETRRNCEGSGPALYEVQSAAC